MNKAKENIVAAVASLAGESGPVAAKVRSKLDAALRIIAEAQEQEPAPAKANEKPSK